MMSNGAFEEGTRKKQAIDGKRIDMFLVDPNKLTIVGLDTGDGEDHPLFDERIRLEVDEALVLNMMIYGNQTPISVRKNGELIEVVDGRQRVRAAREANLRLIAEGKQPIFIRVQSPLRADDATSLGILILSNELRREDTPMAKAKKAARLSAMGRDDETIANTFGVTINAVRNWFKLLKLTPEIQRYVDEEKVSAHAATVVSELPRSEQNIVIHSVLLSAEAGGPKVSAESVRRALEKHEQKKATVSKESEASISSEAVEKEPENDKEASHELSESPYQEEVVSESEIPSSDPVKEEEPIAHETRYRAPGKGTLRKLIKSRKLSEEVREVLLYVTGDGPMPFCLRPKQEPS